MRIITGKARGAKLVTLEGDNTRPTSEMAKEAVFSAIQFDLDSRTILDIFAGSGQMGLEALSRGGLKCTFVDNNNDAVKIIKQNVAKTGFDEQSEVILSDWKAFIKQNAGKRQYNLVFVDPPYAYSLCADVLKRLTEAEMLSPGAIVVLESGSDEYLFAPGFKVRKKQRYGRAFVTILEKETEESE